MENNNKSKIIIVIKRAKHNHHRRMSQLMPTEEKKYSLYGCMERTIEIKGNIVEGTGETWEAEL